MILHTLNKSPFTHQALQSCGQFCSQDDGLILLEDGVYALNHADLESLLARNISVFAIEADVLARGLLQQYALKKAQVSIIDYEAFVALCVKYPKQKSW